MHPFIYKFYLQVAIKRGDEVSTQYLPSTSATYARRPLLSTKWYFECCCPRCSDPTEGGTCLAALACTSRGCGGPLLPLQPLDGEEEWGCGECGGRCSVEEVVARLGRVSATMGRQVAGEDSVEHWERVVATASTLLFPKHYRLLEVKQKLAVLYGQCFNNLFPLGL